MIGLTEAQSELLSYIKQYTTDSRGTPPSYEEMRCAVGLSSKSGVHRLVHALQERGHIRALKNRARSIEVISNPMAIPTLASFTTAQLIAELSRRSITNQARKAR